MMKMSKDVATPSLVIPALRQAQDKLQPSAEGGNPSRQPRRSHQDEKWVPAVAGMTVMGGKRTVRFADLTTEFNQDSQPARMQHVDHHPNAYGSPCHQRYQSRDN